MCYCMLRLMSEVEAIHTHCVMNAFMIHLAPHLKHLHRWILSKPFHSHALGMRILCYQIQLFCFSFMLQIWPNYA